MRRMRKRKDCLACPPGKVMAVAHQVTAVGLQVTAEFRLAMQRGVVVKRGKAHTEGAVAAVVDVVMALVDAVVPAVVIMITTTPKKAVEVVVLHVVKTIPIVRIRDVEVMDVLHRMKATRKTLTVTSGHHRSNRTIGHLPKKDRDHSGLRHHRRGRRHRGPRRHFRTIRTNPKNHPRTHPQPGAHRRVLTCETCSHFAESGVLRLRKTSRATTRLCPSSWAAT